MTFSPVIPASEARRESFLEDQKDSGQAGMTTGEAIPRLIPETRPVFETPTARYEWHLQFGMFTSEDRAWCAWFQTTDDFKMLYTYFEQQM